MHFKSITALAALLLANNASACMQFGARINGDGYILGAIVDNGVTTCQINDNLSSPGQDNEYWFSCISGFAAWLSHDLGTLAYANGPNNYRISVSNNNGNLAASAFC